MYTLFIKRFLDVFIALLALFLFSPIFFIVSISLFFSNRGKIFFTQTRAGKNQELFKILKFKSMNDKKDESGKLLKDTERLTFMGKIIRKTSIDELPQIFNILKGEMSIVGPRPLLPEYLPYYGSYFLRRHELKPGITGLAQVSGRNTLKFSERFTLDVRYIDNCSFLLDAKILFKTFLKIISTKDIQIGKKLSDLDDVGVSQGLE